MGGNLKKCLSLHVLTEIIFLNHIDKDILYLDEPDGSVSIIKSLNKKKCLSFACVPVRDVFNFFTFPKLKKKEKKREDLRTIF